MNISEERKIIDKMVRKPGLRGKLDALCRWCSYDTLSSGTWREQVKNCDVFDCPVYSVRPMPTTEKKGKKT
jgi:hypothetical protein